jgi:hypothetical protein
MPISDICSVRALLRTKGILFCVIGGLACMVSSMAADNTATPEKGREHAAADLCNEAGDVKYSAKWAEGKVTLNASGKHNTGGYQVSLKESPAEIFPPQFTLVHKRPEGIVTQAITPFTVTASFAAAEKPKAVTVTDARGRQSVAVK